jgi:putative ABC transport system ATP-binding protein
LLQTLHLAGQTVVMVTHDARAASYGERIIKLKDGGIIEDIAVSGRAS